MVAYASYLANVNEVFPIGEFDIKEELHIEIPKDFEHKYSKTKVLRLKHAIYGLKQVARMFWILLLMAMRSMKYQKSKVNPCLYFKQTEIGLLLWLT